MTALRTAAHGLLVLVFFAISAQATQLLPLSPERLGSDAELVIQGSVVSSVARWDDENRRILTETRIRVDEAFKGSAREGITIVQPGGVVDGVRMTVHGAVSWNEGEEVLLFLEPSLPGKFRVAGLSQGKFALERNFAGTLMAIPAPLGGARLVGGTPPRPIPLSDLLKKALPSRMEEGR